MLVGPSSNGQNNSTTRGRGALPPNSHCEKLKASSMMEGRGRSALAWIRTLGEQNPPSTLIQLTHRSERGVTRRGKTLTLLDLLAIGFCFSTDVTAGGCMQQLIAVAHARRVTFESFFHRRDGGGMHAATDCGRPCAARNF